MGGLQKGSEMALGAPRGLWGLRESSGGSERVLGAPRVLWSSERALGAPRGLCGLREGSGVSERVLGAPKGAWGLPKGSRGGPKRDTPRWPKSAVLSSRFGFDGSKVRNSRQDLDSMAQKCASIVNFRLRWLKSAQLSSNSVFDDPKVLYCRQIQASMSQKCCTVVKCSFRLHQNHDGLSPLPIPSTPFPKSRNMRQMHPGRLVASPVMSPVAHMFDRNAIGSYIFCRIVVIPLIGMP